MDQAKCPFKRGVPLIEVIITKIILSVLPAGIRRSVPLIEVFQNRGSTVLSKELSRIQTR